MKWFKVSRLFEKIMLISILLVNTAYFKKSVHNYYYGTSVVRINTCDVAALKKIKFMDDQKVKLILKNRPIQSKVHLVRIGVFTEEELNQVRFDLVTADQEKTIAKYMK